MKKCITALTLGGFTVGELSILGMIAVTSLFIVFMVVPSNWHLGIMPAWSFAYFGVLGLGLVLSLAFICQERQAQARIVRGPSTIRALLMESTALCICLSMVWKVIATLHSWYVGDILAGLFIVGGVLSLAAFIKKGHQQQQGPITTVSMTRTTLLEI